MSALVLALQLVLAQNTAVISTPAARESAIWQRVDTAIRAFHLQWRSAWQETQHDRPKHTGDDLRTASMRLLALHCHYVNTPPRLLKYIITGKVTAHASCPMWYPDGLPGIHDERKGIDGALAPGARIKIWALRKQLRSLLDSAAQQLPHSMRITRQRLRFALDAGALRDAWSIATSCTVDHVQCALLQGLVLQRGGYDALADSVFLAAAGMMGEDERCAWTDVGMLLDFEPRSAYEKLSCAQRDSFQTRLWWLADPLYSEAGNERRAEHFARKVLITLLTPLQYDERQRFTPVKGGESVIETLMRYGWPSQMYWAGPLVDAGHSGWLRVHAADTAPPYVVREYTRGRLHTMPSPSAIDSPFQATPDQWQLNGPADPYDWWPVEHFARDRSRIVDLPTGQTVMLRRRYATRFVWAGDLDPALLARRSGEAIRATLFQSRSVADVDSVATFRGRIGSALLVDAPLRRGSTLLAIELSGDTARPAARTRFGTDIIEPLSTLRRSRALSQPLLFAPAGDAASTLDADAAIKRMYGTTTLRRASRLGVYWEAYRFTSTDTVSIELRIVREDRPGLIGRVAGSLGLRQENTSVAAQWREEPGSGRAIEVMEGEVPVQMRSLALDISQLARGSYRLTVSMNQPGAGPVTSERTFDLR